MPDNNFEIFSIDNVRRLIIKTCTPKPEILRIWEEDEGESIYVIYRQNDGLTLTTTDRERWKEKEIYNKFEEIELTLKTRENFSELMLVNEARRQTIINIMNYFKLITGQAKGDIKVKGRIRKLSQLQLEDLSVALLEFITTFELPRFKEDFSFKRKEFISVMERFSGS